MLNFREQDVVDEFSSILKQWLEEGAKGFELIDVPYMLINENLTNEAISNKPGPVQNEYSFYSHTKTKNLDGIGDILWQWRNVVKEYGTENEEMGMLCKI